MDWWKKDFKEDYLKQYGRFLTPGRTEAEANAIEKMLRPKKDDKILDLGCAQGRIAIELAKRGYNVIALDYSRYMLGIAGKRAKKEKVSVKFVRGDMRRINFREEFDIVISWFTTFGYFNDREDASVIKRIARALKENGVLLIDVVNGEWIKNAGSFIHNPRTWCDYKDFIVLESHKYDKQKSRDNCRRIFLRGGRRKEYSWSLRLYSFGEMKSLLLRGGFEIIKIYGGHDLSRFSGKSRRITIVARKKQKIGMI
jgi:ubiquinone/menaquinone biosynthesis C-methylase UbiE